MKKILTFCLFVLPLYVNCQISLNGIVLDTETNRPVEFVTVYINGTANGIITDTSGKFSLTDVMLPCEVVTSHVSYITQQKILFNPPENEIVFHLKEKHIEIPEVSVFDINMREVNLNMFNTYFLGKDFWGENAFIENDSVLIFTREYVPARFTATDSSGTVHYINAGQRLKSLRAYASVPLKIDLPELGYKLHVDLAEFSYTFDEELSEYYNSFLGYFFFEPMEIKSGSQMNKFKRNRLKAYYNSPQHFLRSLYDNSLKENGYQLIHREYDTISGKTLGAEINLYDSLLFDDNTAIITGMEKKNVEIYYYSGPNGKPKDITESRVRNPVPSMIYFLNDSCKFRSDGTIFEYSMVFYPNMGLKLVGATLPDNYKPVE